MASKSLLDYTPQTSYRLADSLLPLLREDARVQSYMKTLTPEQLRNFNPSIHLQESANIQGTKPIEENFYNWRTYGTKEEADAAAKSLYSGIDDTRLNTGLDLSKQLAQRYVNQQKDDPLKFLGLDVMDGAKIMAAIYAAGYAGLIGGEGVGAGLGETAALNTNQVGALGTAEGVQAGTGLTAGAGSGGALGSGVSATGGVQGLHALADPYLGSVLNPTYAGMGGASGITGVTIDGLGTLTAGGVTAPALTASGIGTATVAGVGGGAATLGVPSGMTVGGLTTGLAFDPVNLANNGALNANGTVTPDKVDPVDWMDRAKNAKNIYDAMGLVGGLLANQPNQQVGGLLAPQGVHNVGLFEYNPIAPQWQTWKGN